VTYLGELRMHWRSLLAASIGMGCGYMLNMYLGSLFAPHLIEAFGWSRAQFATTGTTILASLIALPIVGRLTDAYGARPMATVGVIATPLIFVGYSLLNGSFAVYFALSVVQIMVVGGTTTSTVYSRLIAQDFDRTRGLALAIAACTPPADGYRHGSRRCGCAPSHSIRPFGCIFATQAGV
jgi:MFS family permease